MDEYVARMDMRIDEAGELLPGLGYERRERIELWVKDADPYEVRIVSGIDIGWDVEVWDVSLAEVPVHVEGQRTTTLARAIAIADRIVAEDRETVGDRVYRDLKSSV
jgi:hypothetical protein